MYMHGTFKVQLIVIRTLYRTYNKPSTLVPNLLDVFVIMVFGKLKNLEDVENRISPLTLMTDATQVYDAIYDVIGPVTSFQMCCLDRPVEQI